MKLSAIDRGLPMGFVRTNRGLAAVEFGLISPILITLLLGLLDFGLAYERQMNVNAAAEQGASYAVTNGYNATQISNVVTNAGGGIQASPAPTETCGCPTASGITTSSPSTPPCTGTCPDGSAPGIYVTANAFLSYTTIVPWPGLHNPLQLAATEMVRVQ